MGEIVGILLCAAVVALLLPLMRGGVKAPQPPPRSPRPDPPPSPPKPLWH